MPALAKAKYERFAQEIANGTSQSVAYEKAGYRKNPANASTLKKNTLIQQRIAELLEERQSIVTKQYAAEVEYTRERLLGYLEGARERAIEAESPTAEVSATIGMARILGLIIDRREVGDVGAFDGHTDEELQAEAARLARELGLGPVLVEGVGKPPDGETNT